ncbi:MAG: alpha-L-fucosidase [Marinilabiliales bacterium]|nr:alpha-L-fucosidase [Marinilabiliales bacterium]
MREFSPDLYWFDGDWEQSAEKWRATEIRKMILDHNPSAIINSRLAGLWRLCHAGTGSSSSKRPADKYWELCMTMNDSWGYQGNDTELQKLTVQVIRIFAECIGDGRQPAS